MDRNVRKRIIWRAPNEDSDQPAHPHSDQSSLSARRKLRRLTWIFAGRTCPKVLTCIWRVICYLSFLNVNMTKNKLSQKKKKKKKKKTWSSISFHKMLSPRLSICNIENWLQFYDSDTPKIILCTSLTFLKYSRYILPKIWPSRRMAAICLAEIHLKNNYMHQFNFLVIFKVQIT